MTFQVQQYLSDNLGFTPLEASIYIHLLTESPQTGYKISTTLNKSRSQTYQALKSLETKKAIIRLEGTQFGEFIPVPIRDFMDAKEKEFLKQKDEIIETLKDLGPEPQHEHIFRIMTIDQLYNKVNSMIASAKSMILVDTDSAVLVNIHEQLDARAQEGINVMIETTAEAIEDHCYHVKINKVSAKDFEWNADWLCLSIDGEQFLISLLNRETGELIHAIWCGNPYLSPWVYIGMLHEFSFRVIHRLITDETDLETIRHKLSSYIDRFFLPVSGLTVLRDRLAK